MLENSFSFTPQSASQIKLAKKKQLHKHADVAVHLLTTTCGGHPCELVTRYMAKCMYKCVLTL